MKITVPRPIRIGLYLFTMLGSPVVAYALAKGWIGTTEVALWSAETTVVAGIAGLHVEEPAARPRRRT